MRLKYLLFTFLAFLLTISCFGCTKAKNKDLDLVIVHTNDIHGRVKYDPENNVSGFSRASTYISKLKSENKNVIMLDAGDALHGQTIVTVPKGETAVSLMNLMGYNYFTPGNHDFNYGYDRLKELSSKMDFKILASNICLSDGTNPFMENDLIDIEGVKIGIFGLATPETAVKTNPINVKDITFNDPISTAKDQVSKLKNKGADIIIAICHLGIDDESIGNRSYDVRDNVEGLDLIIDGHSHSELEKINQKEGKAVIASTGAYMENLGIVRISMHNGNKKVVPESISFSTLNSLDPDEKVEEMIEDINKNLSSTLNVVVVGNTDVYLEGKKSLVRTKETNLARILTNSILDETNAQVVLVNGGSIRDSIDVGDITLDDVIKISPFGNYIVTKEIKGSDLIASLEHGFQDCPSVAAKFPQTAGMNISIDVNAEKGSRIKFLKINGSDVDANRMYILATNDFVANGGDGYDLIKQSKVVGNFSGIDEILSKYIKKISPITQDVVDRIPISHNF